MKTETQLARTEAEWDAVDSVFHFAHYYFKSFDNPKWREYLWFVESHLIDELKIRIAE